MKPRIFFPSRRFLVLLVLAGLACGLGRSRAVAQEPCHFRRVEIPRNEARLLELSRIVEYRCEFVLALVENTAQFIAERYQDGKCVSRRAFALGVYGAVAERPHEGVISFGWHMDDQKLVAVHDTGYFHRPGFVKLPGFEATHNQAGLFFRDSMPEERLSKGGLPFRLYPVFALRSAKDPIFDSVTVSGKTGTARAPISQENEIASFMRAPDAIIVYLSFGAGLPELDYDK